MERGSRWLNIDQNSDRYQKACTIIDMCDEFIHVRYDDDIIVMHPSWYVHSTAYFDPLTNKEMKPMDTNQELLQRVEDLMETKTCGHCGEVLPTEAFTTYMPNCKKCSNSINREIRRKASADSALRDLSCMFVVNEDYDITDETEVKKHERDVVKMNKLREEMGFDSTVRLRATRANSTYLKHLDRMTARLIVMLKKELVGRQEKFNADKVTLSKLLWLVVDEAMDIYNIRLVIRDKTYTNASAKASNRVAVNTVILTDNQMDTLNNMLDDIGLEDLSEVVTLMIVAAGEEIEEGTPTERMKGDSYTALKELFRKIVGTL